ncbi:4Fe-4S ferredoxin [Helicobacter anseris]|uniref:4Fe-4S ferredoxin n=1 Tax=Helicobacter anseris TaxID=375926 RepID=A0A3D8J560_9HELI|nr:EFR1 family ferrodoxin [Helicobacter anseris]RDU72627.1 4Fe-4S ferredoxin [Helicobacter anseris]
MTILYFTATGNSLYIAKSFKNATLYSIPQLLREKKLEFNDDVIGIITPTHNFSIPTLIRLFLPQAKIKCNYFFTIFTCGGSTLGALDEYAKLAQKQNLTLNYLNRIAMMDNYLKLWDMREQEKKLPQKYTQEKLEQILQDIEKRKNFRLKSNIFYQWFSEMTYFWCSNFVSNHKQFHIEDSCINCNICTKVCPVSNILKSTPKPLYQNHCILCLACTHHCPTHSITLKGEKSKERYRHPQISLREIIQSNQG